MKKVLSFVFHRVVIVALLILLQLGLLIGMMVRFEKYFSYFYLVCTIFALVMVLEIVSDRSHPAYKIAWIIVILLAPVFGGLFYAVFGGHRLSARTRRRMQPIEERVTAALADSGQGCAELETVDPAAAGQSRYIRDYAGCPAFQNTLVDYYPLGDDAFPAMLEALRAAQHYIFMEYFIVEPGEMWNAILAVLREKAAAGVEVRFLYDDLGSIMTAPAGYDRTLRRMGIQARRFNPFIPVVSSRFNNRDHRKICVVDGHTGFTGGINLADEYINRVVKHGHWKDTVVRLQGDAVYSLTMMFLSLWDYCEGAAEDYDAYRPQVHAPAPVVGDCWVQPFGDSPFDDEPAGENVYLNLLGAATDRVWINTPYLIIGNEMVSALAGAAKRGVDVRIVTPHVADKKFVHAMTRSYYLELIEAGVKIYEYTPGFIHAKSFVVDGKTAVIGTINLDYRSLYLHFECGVWMYRPPCIRDMERDYLQTLEKSRPVTLEECRGLPLRTRLARAVLRIFAPLM